MNTFTLKLTRTGQTTSKYVPNCIEYKGAVVSVKKQGVGTPKECGGLFDGEGETWEEYDSYTDVMQPLFDSAKVDQSGVSRNEIRNILIGDAIEKYFDLLIKMGVQEGYIAVNYEQEKQNPPAFTKDSEIMVSDSGFGYLEINTPLPKDVWALVAPNATYCRATDEDMDWFDDQYPGVTKSEIRGWHHSAKGINALVNAGYQVKYKKHLLTNDFGISEVNRMEIEKRNNK